MSILIQRWKVDGEWVKLTYKEYLELIETIAKGFVGLGLEETHSVAVMSSNCHQWCVSSCAAIFAGGKT